MISDLNMDQLISNRKIEVTDTEEVQDKSMKSDRIISDQIRSDKDK
jgi:hypothetical protein